MTSKQTVPFRLLYDGVGPVHWSGGPGDFGIQDKAAVLHSGAADRTGAIAFAFSLEVKDDGGAEPNFLGDFSHGPKGERFVYLGWRNATGELAQRLKIPLSGIGWDQVRQAWTTGAALTAVVVDKTPKATSTGANIGGTRKVAWTVGATG